MNKYHQRAALLLALVLFLACPVFAQADPWTASSDALKDAFTGPIATALILVAIVICGLTFAFSEGQGKKTMAGVIFGGAMAMGAVRFSSWIFQ